jgi:hypothetical protein
MDCSSNSNVIKSKRLLWDGHAPSFRETQSIPKMFTGNLTENGHSGDRCKTGGSIRIDLSGRE